MPQRRICDMCRKFNAPPRYQNLIGAHVATLREPRLHFGFPR